MVEPKQAPVRPRVVSPHTGETLVLEDEILSLAESSRSDTIWVTGGIGYGKSTAIEHLAAVLPASVNVDLVEDDDLDAQSAGRFHGTICSTGRRAKRRRRRVHARGMGRR